MKSIHAIATAFIFGAISAHAADYFSVPRIEKMPAIPSTYSLRDWKDVTRKYIRLTMTEKSGNYLPLSRTGEGGVNYTGFSPIYMDTYVGGNNHLNVSEAINVIPAVVSAYLTGSESEASRNLAEGVMDFFNAKNGQNVYLNNFSANSGKDWWYDLMPNVYFYQLCELADMPEVAESQYLSVADQWLKAVKSLGGKTYDWSLPSMSYRAFNLATMKPLESGVHEPESAGTIAWILFHAYLKTGNEDYRKGAELAMEYLSGLGSNPAYELQLAYGVQIAAKMNAMLGTNYRTTKLFQNCFDRGYLRGWGSTAGKWGDYDMSGLIGEANDNGDDYVFVMNGFQQAAALAPAVKYDKRLARAYGRWMVNLASASRLFYVGFMPDANMEETSLAWSKQNDPDHVIPYEAIKQKWEGKTPFAMGDALRGDWAKTNLSLYSGSSVGYLAAVVEPTDVTAILRLDLNATDFDDSKKYDTSLYYNPYTEAKTVTVTLPSGTYSIYDAITETTLSNSASGTYKLSIPADDTRLITLIPQGVPTKTADGMLKAGDVTVDYHVGWKFDQRLRIKNVEAEDPFPVKGATVKVRATTGGTSSACKYSWQIDGKSVDGTSAILEYNTSSLSVGKHTVAVEISENGSTAKAETEINILGEAVEAPEIVSLTSDAEVPAAVGAKVELKCMLKNPNQATEMSWEAREGTLTSSSDGMSATWLLPEAEGVYEVKVTASNIKGSASQSIQALARVSGKSGATELLNCPFDNSLDDTAGATALVTGSDAAQYESPRAGASGAALKLTGNWFYHPQSDKISPEDAISIAFWAKPSQWTGAEQFIVSHGSWQDRYKLSLTPEKKARWTVKTSENIADVDCSAALSEGGWYHFVAVYTGFSAELYRNGTLEGFAPLSGTLGKTSEPFTVGSMNSKEVSYNFKGSIDDLRIYDRALTPADVEAISGFIAAAPSLAEETAPKMSIRDGMIRFSAIVDCVKIYAATGQHLWAANHRAAEYTLPALAKGIYILTYRYKNRNHGAKISMP